MGGGDGGTWGSGYALLCLCSVGSTSSYGRVLLIFPDRGDTEVFRVVSCLRLALWTFVQRCADTMINLLRAIMGFEWAL